MRRVFLAIVVILLGSAPSHGQSLDDAVEQALTHWRQATWYAQTGNAAVAGIEAEEFQTAWSTLMERFGAAPPPPYDREKDWTETLDEIARVGEAAVDAFQRDDAIAARRELAKIGGLLAALRWRNGIVAFADDLARYRDEIDRVAELIKPDDRPSAERLAQLRAATAQLDAAAAQLERNQPPRWRGEQHFRELLQQNRDAVAALVALLEKADFRRGALDIVGAIRIIRSNYNLLFLRYGAAPHDDAERA
jgi:hypothetical protein